MSKSSSGGSMASPLGRMKLAQGVNDGHGSHVKVVNAGPRSKGVHGMHSYMMGGAGPNVIAKGGKVKGTNDLKGID